MSEPDSTFARFAPRLQEAIVSRLGFTELRPVQKLAGAAILDGLNAVVLAPTAGGKTEASMFPVISGLVERPTEAVGALYVAPIKALLNNQEERLGTYTEMVGLRRFVWHGDAKPGEKKRFVDDPTELLMLTPESMEVMLLSPRVPAQKLFRDLRYVVVDEVHAFAGTDRGAHLMSVLERIARFTEHDVQRIGLSATVGNPEQILVWLKGSSERDGVVIDPPKVKARRSLLVALSDGTASTADRAARMAEGKKSLFFCQSRSMTEAVAQGMHGRGIDLFVHHSSVAREDRHAAEERFHSGTNACIVCTSTLELGIDVGDLDLVFQENATSTVSSFLQRMGRTGRREGSVANTTFFCEEVETVLQAVALIELAKEGWVEPIPEQTRCWPVLLHQLLALTLQFGAVTPEDAWGQLSVVPDFGGISRAEFDEFLRHLVENEFLFESDGRFAMGDRRRTSIRPQELHGALRRLQQPAALSGADSDRKGAGIPRAGIRRPSRREHVLLSAGRSRLDGRPREPLGSHCSGPARPARLETELGRHRPTAPQLRALSEHAPRLDRRGRRVPLPRRAGIQCAA